MSAPRSQVALGNALVPAVVLPWYDYHLLRRAKQSFENKFRSQVQLGNEEERSAIWGQGVCLMMIAFDAKHKQRFNAGKIVARMFESPQGRKKRRRTTRFCRFYGTSDIFVIEPSVETLGYCQRKTTPNTCQDATRRSG